MTSARQGTFNLDQCRFTQFPQGSKGYEGHKEIDAEKNVFQISQRYALERFCQAIASRGAVPPNANGSLFTMDMPSGVMVGYNRISESPISPVYRYWQECCWFMWQNLRFPYWAMASRGDYDTLRPGMQYVRDSLDNPYLKKENTIMFRSQIIAGVLTFCGFFTWATGAMAEEPKPPVVAEKPAQENVPLKEFSNSIGMKMVPINAGEFTMGDNAWHNNKPHPVRITKPFFMQAMLVTQTQYTNVMGKNPSSFKEGDPDVLPVDSISWATAQEFVKKLSEL